MLKEKTKGGTECRRRQQAHRAASKTAYASGYLPKCSADIVTCSFLRQLDRARGFFRGAGPHDGNVHAILSMHRGLQYYAVLSTVWGKNAHYTTSIKIGKWKK